MHVIFLFIKINFLKETISIISIKSAFSQILKKIIVSATKIHL